MKLKKDYIMTKLEEDRYMIVSCVDVPGEPVDTYSTNEAGASMWRAIQNGADTKEKIVDVLMNQYEDADRAVVLEDVNLFLETISEILTE